MRVNEIFVSLQGEGHFTGTAAVFLRLSGCNLNCPFCDTLHESHVEMTEEEVVMAVRQMLPRHIVITGGEPSLQLTASLLELLHQEGFYVQIETNGTCALPPGIDWVTCSPKEGGEVVLEHIDELKVLYQGEGTVLPKLEATEYRLQPLDTGHAKRNKKILSETINYIIHNPKWKLSLQTHKILNVR